MNLSSLLDDQISSQGTDGRETILITGIQRTSQARYAMAYTYLVTADHQVRDELRDLVQARLNRNLKLLELGHQPAERSRLWDSL